MDIKYDFNDILIKQSSVSYFNSRSVIDIFDEIGMLPIFTAPMIDVVNDENSEIFIQNKIYSIIPRKNEYDVDKIISNNPKQFISLGLIDFQKYVLDNDLNITSTNKAYILIDIANGNMVRLFKMISSAKDKYHDNIIIMAGNIANPETYRLLSDAGADFIRLGIGNGSACLTTEQSAIGYPMASLISDTYAESLKVRKPAKIIADGGIKKYSDVIKSLALGADYVMLGGILNKTLESAGDCYIHEVGENNISQYIKITNEEALKNYNSNIDIYKQYKGMSTKEVQRLLGNDVLKTSEGIVKYNKVEYTLDGWVENMRDYLKSNMSYCGKKNLDEFIGKVDFINISYNSFLRYNK